MCFGVAACLPANYCCFSELALSALVWYKAAIMSSKVTCSRHGIVDNLLIWRQTTIIHSLRQNNILHIERCLSIERLISLTY